MKKILYFLSQFHSAPYCMSTIFFRQIVSAIILLFVIYYKSLLNVSLLWFCVWVQWQFQQFETTLLKFFDCSLKEIWIVGLPLFKKNLKGWMTRSVNRQSYVSLKILHQWRNANLIIPCSDPRDNMFREVIGKCGVLPVF